MNFNVESYFNFEPSPNYIPPGDPPPDALIEDGTTLSQSFPSTDPLYSYIDSNYSGSPLASDATLNYDKRKPFRIIRSNDAEDSIRETINSKSKKIQKPAKPAAIMKTQREAVKILSQAPSKYIPPEFYKPDTDLKTRRKMIQVVKNRMSAQRTRDKKKALFGDLELKNYMLSEENEKLNEKNSSLVAKVEALEKVQKQLLQEVHELKKNNSRMNSTVDYNHTLASTAEGDSMARITFRGSIDLESHHDVNIEEEIAPPVLTRVSSSSSQNSCFGKFFALTVIAVVLLNPDVNSDKSISNTLVYFNDQSQDTYKVTDNLANSVHYETPNVQNTQPPSSSVVAECVTQSSASRHNISYFVRVSLLGLLLKIVHSISRRLELM